MADSNDGGSIDVGAVRGGRGSTMAVSPAEPINVFAVMDGLVEKCKVLDYEEHFLRKRPDLKPLSCVYFALPTKPSEQFPYFSSLTSWLLSLVGHDAIEFSEFDDPNSIATSILEHVRRLGFQPDFPASKLRHGSGDMVCLTLDFLATKALQARRFTVLPPVYTAASAPMPVFEGGSDGGGSSGFGGFGDEIAEDDQDERNDPMSAFGQDADSSEDEAEGGGFAVAPVSKAEEAALKLKRQKERDDRSRLMQQEVDSKAWQAEYERVVVLLKMPVTGVSREWKTHLDTSQKHATQLNAVIPATMGQVAKESEILKKALERIRGKEKHINTEYEELGREMRTIAAAHEKIQAEYNTVSTRVAEMTALLKHKTAEVEALKEKMREHNDKMSDTTPLRRMGQSVQALKKEVVKMELRIGIVQQIVGQGQVRRQQEEIKRQRREERERKEKGRGNGANDRLLPKSMV